jgi:L-malate glycosyltransferase
MDVVGHLESAAVGERGPTAGLERGRAIDGMATQTSRSDLVSPRVLQVVLSLAPGGTERLVIELARRLHGTCGMAVCCLDEPGAWAQELLDRGISVTSLGRRPGFAPKLGRQIAAIAREQRATVLHCHHYSPFVYGTLARWWQPLQMVFTEHGRADDGPPSRKRQMVNQLFGRVPARIYAVSHDLRQHMIAEGFPATRVDVIYNGVEPGTPPPEYRDSDKKALLGLTPTDLVVGAVGRLDPVKDLPTLLAAFRQVATAVPNARLVLIGDGPERHAVAQLIADLELTDRVTVTGYRRDVRELLPALDVYVNTSVFEGVSLTILEAMAAGLPVVATRVGGTPEVVVHGRTGLLVPPRDPSGVAGAIHDLLRDARQRAALGRAGRSRVEQQFSIDRMVGEYESAYNGQEVSTCVA